MIYRIDIQHYLSHAIDYFTVDELTHFQYAIISAVVRNGSRMHNVTKVNNLYPTPDIVIDYAEYKDKELMRKMYMDYLQPKNDQDGIGKNVINNIFYNTFINPLMLHHDIVIICDKTENDYIDVICDVLNKEYHIEVIDLNKLFIEGKIGSIYIDRKDIRDRAVDIRRAAGKDQIKALESTSEGRMHLLKMMNNKTKIKKIEELGIKLTSYDKDDLDSILIDAWVNDDDDD